jgi:hypothetical protein
VLSAAGKLFIADAAGNRADGVAPWFQVNSFTAITNVRVNKIMLFGYETILEI